MYAETADSLVLWNQDDCLIFREGHVSDRYRLDGLPLEWRAHGLLCVEEGRLVMKEVGG